MLSLYPGSLKTINLTVILPTFQPTRWLTTLICRGRYVLGRTEINKPQGIETVPQLADLTTEITEIDGKVLTQLVLSGFAKMSTKVDELNKINVFPIADGETRLLCQHAPDRGSGNSMK